MSKFKTMAEVDALPTELLIEAPPVPRGDVCGIFGDGSVGKGRLCMSFVRQVTDEGGTCVVVLPEDHANEQVRPRIDAAGADPGLVVNLTRLPGGSRFKLSATERNDGHLGLLRECVEELTDEGHDPRLLVIDRSRRWWGGGRSAPTRGRGGWWRACRICALIPAWPAAW